MVTLKQVAAAAGVHFTVASSILNGARGNSRYSARTRQLVEDAAARLGYERNETARSLRTRQAHLIGLVAGNIRNPFFATLATALERHLSAEGYGLLLATHGSTMEHNEKALIRSLQSRSVDAILVWSEGEIGLKPKELSKSGKPIVWLGMPYPGEWCLKIDIRHGLQLAVGHLIERNCRRLAFFSPEEAAHTGLPRPRPELFREVVAERGLIPQIISYSGQSWDLASATAAARKYLTSSGAIDAVIGHNDVAATAWLIAQQRLSDRQRSLVVGFDGTDWMRVWQPPIPFVDLRIDDFARQAVSIARKAMDHANTTTSTSASNKPPRRQFLWQPILRA